jgi:DNA repair exonuclease SbcCD ATPase subunit
MTDIVERIRGLRYIHVPVASELFEEAANEIERLKQRVAELAHSKEQLELRVLDLIMTRAKNALVTLTDEEREAVEQAADFIDSKSYASAAPLRGLLERLK